MKNKIQLFIVSFIALFVLIATPIATVDAASGTKCGSTKTQLIGCEGKTGVGSINNLISIAVNVMTVIIGIIAVGGLAYAAILYASARDSESQTGQAITIIRNIVIGILLYGFTIALINWLIPGGVIG
ncbi:MAG: hypothetical protein WAW80_05065 [Candidatus Saccharimonadales bacterium]